VVNAQSTKRLHTRAGKSRVRFAELICYAEASTSTSWCCGFCCVNALEVVQLDE
jgi:hypothetical protein